MLVAGNKGSGASRADRLLRLPRLLCRAVSAGLPEPARPANTAAGDLPNPRNCPLRILPRPLPASFFALACTLFPNDFRRTGKWPSLSRLVSQGIVVFPFIPRKDAVSLFHRP